MAKVSVIMLTYNRENLIERAIKSVLAQTMKDFEYIIVDNGSSDNSGKIAESYANKDNRLKVIHIEKATIGVGRNKGLSIATGEYVTFIDDDDTMEPDMLEFLYKLATDNNADISFCGSTKEVDGEFLDNCVFDDIRVMTPEEAVVMLLKRKQCNAAMPSKLLKLDIFNNIKFEVNKKYDDIHTTYKCFAEAKCVVAHGVPKYCFWRHPGNNSAFTTNDLLLQPEQLDEYFKAFRERTEYVSHKLPSISDYVQYSEWSYMISMCNKISKANLVNCSKQLEYVKKELSENYDEFYNSPYVQDFEKEFMKKYIKRI